MSPADLTERELEVATRVGRGFSYVEIGKELGISDRTVEVYVHRAATKIRKALGLRPAPASRIVRDWAHKEL